MSKDKTKNVKSNTQNAEENAINEKYLSDGFDLINEHHNAGYAGSYTNNPLNEKGMHLTNDGFKKILKKAKIENTITSFPNEFIITIKFSPIAMFKKWIFTVSNYSFLKVSERKKEFTEEFYCLPIKKKFTFQKIVSNVAHEKYLHVLFDKIGTGFEQTFNFSTFFQKDQKLVVFKDFATSKTHSVTIPGVLVPKKMYPIRINVLRDAKGLKFKLIVNRGKIIKHAFSIPGKITITEAPKVKQTVVKSFKSMDDYRSMVLELVKTFDGVERTTNKFANIALGRINKIPVLVNLSAKNKNIKVKLKVNQKNLIQVFDVKNILIKTFTISKKPKSNWLEKK